MHFNHFAKPIANKGQFCFAFRNLSINHDDAEYGNVGY